MSQTDDLLRSFDLSPTRGCLPETDPLASLPPYFAAWDRLAGDLPKLLMTDHLRPAIERLPALDTASLRTPAELERAMMVLSYLGHAYVWTGTPVHSLPAPLAVPWHAIATRIGRPPVLSYPSYALHNWRRFDVTRPPMLGNIALLQNFWGGADEEWFILIHIDIEYHAGPLLKALAEAHTASAAGDRTALTTHLTTAGDAMTAMYATLDRMPQWCDPYVYYHRVRPYIHGWRNNPALPNGLVYDGVTEYAGAGQHFRGETGAQSSIIPCVDAVLGITHAPGFLNDYLLEMRTYMHPRHRAYIEHLESGPSARTLVDNAPPALTTAYNRCVELQERFRAKHYEYAATYIHKQGQSNKANPTDVGTGGTPFMPYLKKHLDETTGHKVGG